MVLAKDLKKGSKIILENVIFTVESIETSKIAKHGKSKCRIEALDINNKKKIFIVLSDENIKMED
ncbi:hypothetical protein J4214_00890 [Candidatus Woesearchaeota archaeon]|nr:hypothetical protein [Candidatus Woesearchaeota archaeon]